MKRLRDEVRLDIVYDDQTAYGSALTGRADATVRQACAGIAEFRKVHGIAATLTESRRLWKEAFSGELSAFFEKRDVLRETCLYPDPSRVTPVALSVRTEQSETKTIPLNATLAAELASWIFQFQCGTLPPALPAGRFLYDQLDECAALTGDTIVKDSSTEGDAVFIGHATVLVNGAARLVVDPFILPRSGRYPEHYQPHRIADLLPLDGVLITHSHPDHFDLSTLLRLGPDIPICVPHVKRESLLAVDMASRLEQLGFSHVKRVQAGDEIGINNVTIRVLPFFGEQATTGNVLHPEVRNTGCTYICESGTHRMFFIADSGRDHAGDVRTIAATVRDQFGSVDILFGGYRAFAMYPIFYLFSSVARFLLFVPSSDLMVRQEIMNDGDALLDTAEICSADYVVPYAAGGAPWYWEHGLGWRPQTISHLSTDLAPDEVVRLAAARGTSPDGPVASPVRVLPLRPGEFVRLLERDAIVEHGPKQEWPYDPPQWHQVNVAPSIIDGSMLSSARVLFREIEPWLSKWQSEHQLVRFFFMRKPPGIRLRFFARSTILLELTTVLDGLTDKGAVEAWFNSVYEPEVHRFGGPAGMDAAHEWFDADTRNWMKLEQLRVTGRASVAREALCAAVAVDLVKRTVPDRGESWAVWSEYISSIGLPRTEAAAGLPIGGIAALAVTATPAERSVFEEYEEADRRLSAALLRIWNTGELTVGLRSMLGAVILFHFNRHGLDSDAHARIAWTMRQALDPAFGDPPGPAKL